MAPATTTGNSSGYNPFSTNLAMQQVIAGQQQRMRGASEDARALGMLTATGRQGSSTRKSFFETRRSQGRTPKGMVSKLDFSADTIAAAERSIGKSMTSIQSGAESAAGSHLSQGTPRGSASN